MKACIVLPTYNEKENIQILIPELLKVFSGLKHEMHILVVDDNSPDGTLEAVKSFEKKNKNIHHISGNKEGLGKAYLRGFKHVLSEMKMDAVFMMDADLQHPPDLISLFLRKLEEGYDFVIGSRYIPGGATPDWALSRKIISRGGNFFARIVGGLFHVHDCTSGYRAIKTDLLKKIDFSTLHTRGYAFMSTLLFEATVNGARFAEIPLIFRDRMHGKTKLQRKDLIEFFFNAWRLRFKSSKRMIKFAIVGGSGIIVNLSVFALAKQIIFPSLGETKETLLLCSLIGDEVSIIYNFLLNDFWTFRGTKSKGSMLSKAFRFQVVALSSVLINNSILLGLHIFFGVPDMIAKLIGIIVAFVWNYLVNTKWTWRE